MRDTFHAPFLTLMVLLAGCAAGDPMRTPRPSVPEPPSPELAQPRTPVPSPNVLGWVPDVLNPQVQDVSRPWGNLEHPVVIIQDNRYHPYYTHVSLGGSVTWINRDRTIQSVTSPIPGGSTQEGHWEGVLAPGESYTKTFSRYTGTFTYHSTYTPDLRGNVIVVGARR